MVVCWNDFVMFKAMAAESVNFCLTHDEMFVIHIEELE